MKEKHLLTLLSIEAAACVLFCILQRSVSGFFSTIVAFPFEQLGEGLRALSLSGGAGNAAAILFYVLLSLIPAGIWLILKKKQKAMPIDFTLFLLSVLLFVVLSIRALWVSLYQGRENGLLAAPFILCFWDIF